MASPTPLERAHRALVKAHNIHMNPATLRTAVDAVLDGMVAEDHAEKRYHEGLRSTLTRYRTLEEARDVLKGVRKLIDHSLSWSGPPEWRDEITERLDLLIASLQDTNHPHKP